MQHSQTCQLAIDFIILSIMFLKVSQQILQKATMSAVNQSVPHWQKCDAIGRALSAATCTGEKDVYLKATLLYGVLDCMDQLIHVISCKQWQFC